MFPLWIKEYAAISKAKRDKNGVNNFAHCLISYMINDKQKMMDNIRVIFLSKNVPYHLCMKSKFELFRKHVICLERIRSVVDVYMTRRMFCPWRWFTKKNNFFLQNFELELRTVPWFKSLEWRKVSQVTKIQIFFWLSILILTQSVLLEGSTLDWVKKPASCIFAVNHQWNSLKSFLG